jgi:hypothetical protein
MQNRIACTRVASVLIGLLPCTHPAAAQETWVKAEGPVYVFVYANHTSLGVGDTLRLRTMVLSAADTAVTLNVRPCGIDVRTTLVVRPVTPPAACDVMPTRLEPGDSIWADWLGLMQTVGADAVEIRHAAHITADNSDARMGALRVTVMAQRTSRAPAPSVRRLPYAVRVVQSQDVLGYGEEEVRQVIARAIVQQSAAAIELAAGTAVREGIAHQIFEVEFPGGGRFDLRTRWIRSDPSGPAPCANALNGGRFDPVTFGATLTQFVAGTLDRIEQNCRGGGDMPLGRVTR